MPAPTIWRLIAPLCLTVFSACATNTAGVSAPVSTSSPALERDASSTNQSPSPAAIPEPAEVEAQPDPAPPVATPASSLLTSVDDAVASGDLERAAALNERALRIAPRDAYLWFRLADIRFQQGQLANAEGIARRALSFAGNDQVLTENINRLLSRISAALR